jgi:Secretin and TonB N terminus short domain
VQELLACALAIAIGILSDTSGGDRAADLSEQSRRLSFDIKPQTLAHALDAFALQTHQQILFTPEIVKGKTTRGVQGTLTSDAALTRLLAGTGLAFSRSTGGLILISPEMRRGAQLQDPTDSSP